MLLLNVPYVNRVFTKKTVLILLIGSKQKLDAKVQIIDQYYEFCDKNGC